MPRIKKMEPDAKKCEVCSADMIVKGLTEKKNIPVFWCPTCDGPMILL